MSRDADDQVLLHQVIDYYHATLKHSPDALAYLTERGIGSPEAIECFKLGYADRTLGLRLGVDGLICGSPWSKCSFTQFMIIGVILNYEE